MKRILFLDDAPERVKVFKQTYIGYNYDIAMNYEECIKLLKTNYYDVVFLDHDLDERSYAGIQDPSIKTGNDVAKFINTLPKCPDLVIVHSLNPEGAKNICKTLADRSDGVRMVQRIPFAWQKVNL